MIKKSFLIGAALMLVGCNDFYTSHCAGTVSNKSTDINNGKEFLTLINNQDGRSLYFIYVSDADFQRIDLGDTVFFDQNGTETKIVRVIK